MMIFDLYGRMLLLGTVLAIGAVCVSGCAADISKHSYNGHNGTWSGTNMVTTPPTNQRPNRETTTETSRYGTIADNRDDKAYNQVPKPKAAVYIMGNPEGRDALRMAVNTFLIKSGRYQMIAVDAIDVVAQEQKRQMSGSVSDAQIAKFGYDAGAQYVCVVERTEFDGYSYVATRMVSVQTKVAEFADMVELPHGGKIIDIIQWQIGSMLGMAVGPRPQASTQKSKEEIQAEIQRLEQKKREEQASRGGNTAAGYTASAPVRTEPPIQGTLVPGGSLTEKLAWLQRSADSHNTYILEVNADESITPQEFYYSGTINITIVLRGVGGNRTIRLKSHGNMFTIRQNVTFILDNNITLLGHSGNTKSLVDVSSGTFKMNAGATITGNPGGGVSLSGIFEMNGGTISGNGNSEKHDGGGVNGGTFTMNGGTISGNISSAGGGVYSNGTFNMRGGIISGNTATKYGGGVYIGFAGKINKLGGTITGNNSDPANRNAVKDDVGNVLARRGHAVYVNENWRKETTAGPGDNLYWESWGLGCVCNGAWDR